MSTTPAPSLIEQAEASGLVLFSSVTALPKDGSAPEWVTLFPNVGRVETRDGRAFEVEAAALIAAFKADDIMIPVDVNHATDMAGLSGGRADAVGWGTALREHRGGLQMKVDWLAEGRELLAARKYLYTSPSFYQDNGRAIRLKALALVTSPALARQPALAAAEARRSTETPMKSIAKALGLAEDANEAACLSALGGRVDLKDIAPALGLPATADKAALLSAIGARVPLADVAGALGLPATSDKAACLSAIGALKSGGNEMVGQLQAQLSATATQLNALVKETRDREVSELIEGALKDRRIVPAQRASLETLCASDDGLKNVKAMLAATVPGLQGSGLEGRTADDGSAAADPIALAAKATKIQRERREAGQPIGYAEAVQLASETQG